MWNFEMIKLFKILKIINHFKNNDSYTTKNGLSKNLKNLV